MNGTEWKWDSKAISANQQSYFWFISTGHGLVVDHIHLPNQTSPQNAEAGIDLRALLPQWGDERWRMLYNICWCVYIYIISGWWWLNHLEKYEFVNGKDDISYMKWKIKNVPNHQPDIYIYIRTYLYIIIDPLYKRHRGPHVGGWQLLMHATSNTSMLATPAWSWCGQQGDFIWELIKG